MLEFQVGVQRPGLWVLAAGHHGFRRGIQDSLGEAHHWR